jgi:hypothetical protein
VTRNSKVIARESAAAADSGAMYTPAPDVRRDEVKVTCVDTRPRFAIDCERVVVLVNEKAVPALRSSSGPQTLTNERGATWQVGGAEAFYPAAALSDGFVVTAIGRGGPNWTLVVTAEDAVERLLLGPSPAAR